MCTFMSPDKRICTVYEEVNWAHSTSFSHLLSSMLSFFPPCGHIRQQQDPGGAMSSTVGSQCGNSTIGKRELNCPFPGSFFSAMGSWEGDRASTDYLLGGPTLTH